MKRAYGWLLVLLIGVLTVACQNQSSNKQETLKDRILSEHGKYQDTAENRAMCPYLNGTRKQAAASRSQKDWPNNSFILLVRSACSS